MTVEENTIKYAKALTESFLPKLKGVKYTEVTIRGGEEIWGKPRKATLQEKMRFINVYAERQAKLQAQIDWLHAEQEKHRKEAQ